VTVFPFFLACAFVRRAIATSGDQVYTFDPATTARFTSDGKHVAAISGYDYALTMHPIETEKTFLTKEVRHGIPWKIPSPTEQCLTALEASQLSKQAYEILFVSFLYLK
jgi:hypothetical protein